MPSHASLLTGLAPWEHGMHGRGRSRLPEGVPTIAARLRPLGYRSISLSANPYLGHAFGLVDAFDEAFWGGWHEPFLRGLVARPRGWGSTPRKSVAATLASRQMINAAASAVERHPQVLDRFLRTASRWSDAPEGSIAGWIEPTLSGFLDRQPRDRPVFALVNLLDAHEPYIGLPGAPATERTPRQDRASWVCGAWDPTRLEFDALHRAYRSTFQILEERFRRIQQILQDHERWNDAVVVVTSDHGQAFGESGILYHGLRPDESLLRVPLMVRWPGAADAGRQRADRMSIAGVHDLTVAAAHRTAPPWEPSVPRWSHPFAPAAIGDGLIGGSDARMPAPRRAEVDRTYVAGYAGDRKVTLDVASGEYVEYDLERDPWARRPLAPGDRSTPHGLAEYLRRIAGEAFPSASSDVRDRLAGWGYL